MLGHVPLNDQLLHLRLRWVSLLIALNSFSLLPMLLGLLPATARREQLKRTRLEIAEQLASTSKRKVQKAFSRHATEAALRSSPFSPAWAASPSESAFRKANSGC